MCYPGICLKGLQKTMKICSDSRSPDEIRVGNLQNKSYKRHLLDNLLRHKYSLDTRV
jgi:hypothetical protein